MSRLQPHDINPIAPEIRVVAPDGRIARIDPVPFALMQNIIAGSRVEFITNGQVIATIEPKP